MPSTNVEGMNRKILPVIYAIDTSGSMMGDRISSVNQAMREAIDLLKDVSDSNANVEVRVAVLKFDTAAEWVKGELAPLEDYFWDDLKAGGMTNVSNALAALDENFSSAKLFNSEIGYKTPVVIFMSDGAPTDRQGEWEKKLEWVTKHNKWFRIAIKVAIAIGDDADRACLTKLVGSVESVVSVHDNDALKSLIKAVTINTIMAGETRRVKDGENLGDDIAHKSAEDAEIWDNWNDQNSGGSASSKGKWVTDVD